MFTFKLVYDFSPVSFPEERIRERFAKEAGELVIESIREVLGNVHELGYDISDEYAIRKLNDPRLRVIESKSATQPMILSAEMYEGLEFEQTDTGFLVRVKDSAGVSESGFDYADYFNEDFQGSGLHFMEKGLDKVEHLLPNLLRTIVIEEIGW